MKFAWIFTIGTRKTVLCVRLSLISVNLLSESEVHCRNIGRYGFVSSDLQRTTHESQNLTTRSSERPSLSIKADSNVRHIRPIVKEKAVQTNIQNLYCVRPTPEYQRSNRCPYASLGATSRLHFPLFGLTVVLFKFLLTTVTGGL